MSQLAQYTEIAKRLDNYALRYSITDIHETMELWKGEPITHPYNQQLLAQWDAYTVELHNRQRRGRA
jgi:hypothetical protein